LKAENCKTILLQMPQKCFCLCFVCTKFNFGWGSIPDLSGEAVALPGLSSYEKGRIRDRKEGKGCKGEGKVKREG